MTEFTTIRYEPVEDHIVRVLLNRPDKRNAQNHTMTYELNEAFDEAAANDDVKVILLEAVGPHFCAGHDQLNRGTHDDIKTVGTWHGYDLPGIEGRMARNKETYFDMCWRWRNIPKPIIAGAHGKTIAGGLPLLWISDIIVASDDATFADPTPYVGVNGVEYFGHPWEFGPRKAKELLFTSDYVTAQDAHTLGMVNHVVPRNQLRETVLDLARKTARKPSLGLKLAKEAVNGMLDTQGQFAAMRAAFSLCTIGHAQIDLVGRPEDGFGPGFINVTTGRVNPAAQDEREGEQVD
jgi:enoyl-CoA hydratase/carnithine racemase